MSTHPLHSLGFEAVPSLADLGFEPQLPVGTQEPLSGRKIVQPTRSPAINQSLATEAMAAYKARLTEVIRQIPGATLVASRDEKNPHRLREKIQQEGQPAETVSDYGAAQIAVDSPQAKDAVVAAIRRHFTVLREQDHFALGDAVYRYRSDSLQLQMPNGASQELQIVPRPVFEANRQEHHDYKRARNALTAAREINDAAMERFNSRNGVVKGLVTKGSEVRLADGTVARVLYADPNMRIARVRTQDGRNITVRHRDLKRDPGS
jgi:hypothetical protein